MWHDTGSGASELPAGGWLEPGEHSENPATKRRLKNLLDATGLTDGLLLLPPRAGDGRGALLRVHPEAYVDRIRELSQRAWWRRGERGARSATAPTRSRSSRPGARSRRSTRCSTARSPTRTRSCGRRVTTRSPDLGMGFCIFANVAVGIRHAQATRGIGRVAVVDWDVHHGNGTQAVFWDDPSVLAISLHQDGLYPARSGLLDAGRGAGRSGHDAQRPAACRLGNRCLSRRARPGRRPCARGIRPGADRDRVRLRRRRARPARAHAAPRRGVRRDDRAPARCGRPDLRRPARRLARGRLLGRPRSRSAASP